MEPRLLQIASSFTSIPIAKALRAGIVAAGVADDLAFSQYSQMTEYMLGLAPDAPEIVGTVVLVRVEDWLRDDLKTAAAGTYVAERARQILRVSVDEIGAQVESLARRGKPLWFLACPSVGWIAERQKLETLCRTFTNLLVTRIQGLPGITNLTWPATSLPDSNEFSDRNADRLGQIPFTRVGFERLGQFLGEEIGRTFAGNPAGGMASSADGAGLAVYLTGLQVRVRVSTAKPADRAHVDRILRTAAAFSLKGEKRDLADSEVDALVDSGRCMVIQVSDRLSDHGIGGVIAYRTAEDSLVVEAMALSCPVLGKQVEYAVVSGLAKVAAQRNCETLVFEYRPAGRNQIMCKFLQSVTEAESEAGYVLRVGEAEERVAKAAVASGTWTLEFGT